MFLERSYMNIDGRFRRPWAMDVPKLVSIESIDTTTAGGKLIFSIFGALA